MAAQPPRSARYGRNQRRRPPPPGRLDFLKGIFRPFHTARIRVKRYVKQAGGPNLYRLAVFALSLLIIAATAAAAGYAALRKNANDVLVGDTRAGTIKINKKITAASLRDLAVNKIENEIGMRIRINEEVSFEPVRASGKSLNTEEYIVASIAGALTYNVEAAVITVDGERLAALKNIPEAEAIRDNILESYVQEGSVIIEKGFVEDFEIRLEFIEQNELTDTDRAYRELTATTGAELIHTVRGGDTLWQISLDSGMSLDELYELNPGLTSNIRDGQEIVMITQKPVLSVRTVEEVKYTEVIPKKTEYIQNSSQLKTYSRVIQQGRDGQQDVTAHIIRINGFTTDKEIVDFVVTSPEVNDVIEVGTK